MSHTLVLNSTSELCSILYHPFTFTLHPLVNSHTTMLTISPPVYRYKLGLKQKKAKLSSGEKKEARRVKKATKADEDGEDGEGNVCICLVLFSWFNLAVSVHMISFHWRIQFQISD